MIVSCEKCTKKFNIRDNLIPEEGRLLQCGSCNHKWFYKAPAQNINLDHDNINDLENSQSIKDSKEKIIKEVIQTSTSIEKKENNKNEKENIDKTIKKTKKEINLIKSSVVLIISIIALLILIDTFKYQLENYIPSINSILNNLYETLKDLSLFAKDLIN